MLFKINKPAKLDTAILLRTHYWDNALSSFATELQNALPYDLFILIDETGGAAAPTQFPSVGLDKNYAARNGLLDTFPQVTWRCGDYFLYLARQRLPHYRFYWMLDHDVRFSTDNPHKCLAIFNDVADVDLLACYSKLAEAAWDWSKSFPTPTHKSAYALVRLSGRAIDLLLDRRQTLTELYLKNGIEPNRWPNDEAFTATTLHESGLLCRDINSFGQQLYDTTSFTFLRPTPLSVFHRQPADNKIHHPVLHGLHLFNKWMSIAFCTPSFDFDWFASYLRGLIGLEWTAEQAQQLLAHIEKMRLERQRGAGSAR